MRGSLLGMAAALGLFAGAAVAGDDFDTYTDGSVIVPQGGWEAWDDNPAGENGIVTSAQALSAPQSLEIDTTDDIIHQFSGATSGQWVFTAWQYVPDDFAGITYFILLNTYNHGGPYNWSCQVQMDSASGQVISDGDGGTLTLVTGQWVELRVEIDLDADTQDFYYGGSLLYSKSWTEGFSGGGVLDIACVDLFANGASPVYYDDLSLVSTDPTLTLVADDNCYFVPPASPMSGDTMVVAVELGNGYEEIAGGQFFLQYDNTVLDFESADPGDNPFTIELSETVDEDAGTIDYAVNIPFTLWPLETTNMAYFTFTPIDEACDVSDLVFFRDNEPPTRLTLVGGGEILPALTSLPPLWIDGVPPVIVCPDDLLVEWSDWEEFRDKMHFPQYPDEIGWDVNATWPKVLADDWLCIESGPVQDLHFWGSWRHGLEGQILFFRFSIHEDIPDPDGDGPLFSMPGALLWDLETDDFGFVPVDPPSQQGWYDPNTGEFIENDHEAYFRYDVVIPEELWFLQEEGTIYWLDISAIVLDPEVFHWGWKTSLDHFNDDATWSDFGEPPWEELRDPITGESLDLAFIITAGPGGPPDTGTPTVTDVCDPAPTVTSSDAVTVFGCPSDFDILRTWVATDFCGNSSQCDQLIAVRDMIPPALFCPPDISVNAEAGICSASVDVGQPLVGDNCDPNPVVTVVRSDGLSLGAPYPGGVTTTVTWTAMDCSGNASQCVQSVTVSLFNELVVDVELSPTMDPGPLDRCITFVVSGNDPTQTVSQVLAFTGGLAQDVTVLVPCGDYDCIEARDVLHTTQRAQLLGLSGTQYTADFTVDPDLGGDWLVGGNLNDDPYVDILDFGVFFGELNTNYGTGDTTCSTPFPHADIDGDAMVDTVDYLFISLNFLARSEVGCPAWPDIDRPAIGAAGPVTRISVKELERRGLGHLAIADLNRDGWLDTADMRAFANGARP